jgi:hypothetical protein
MPPFLGYKNRKIGERINKRLIQALFSNAGNDNKFPHLSARQGKTNLQRVKSLSYNKISRNLMALASSGPLPGESMSQN